MKQSEPRLFVTDYASYNEGTQFEFGHWVDLSDFSDANDFMQYLSNHFKECDEKRPLACGSPREEYMFTDYEGFPRQLYSESMGGKDMEFLSEWIELDDDDKVKAAYLMENGESVDRALSFYDNVYMREYDGSRKVVWELFEECYPEAEDIENTNPYVSIDYDAFIRNEFNEFEYDGMTYLVQSNY
jgi:antirestriction protein